MIPDVYIRRVKQESNREVVWKDFWLAVNFIYFWPLYTLITLNEHPAVDEWDVNMVEGCHIGWYGQVVQAQINWELTETLLFGEDPLGDADLMNFMKKYSFALVTPLEYLYPQMAYCQATPG